MKTSELRKHRAPLLNIYPGQSGPQDAYVEIRPREDGSAPDVSAGWDEHVAGLKKEV